MADERSRDGSRLPLRCVEVLTANPDLQSVCATIAREFGVPAAVHPEDPLLRRLLRNPNKRESEAVLQYFQSGRRSAEQLAKLVKQSRQPEKIHVLEVASGYGHLTRHLPNTLPQAEITGCDFDPTSVSFVKRELQGRAIQCPADPEAFIVDRRFDAVFALSLFQRLPESAFAGWLQRLSAVLTPNGILVFTACGEHSLSLLGDPDVGDRGFWHGSTRKGASLEESERATTLATFDYCYRQIRAIGDVRLTFFRAGGWPGRQDMYVVTKLVPTAHAPRGSHDARSGTVTRGTAPTANADPIAIRDPRSRMRLGIAGDLPSWIEFNRSGAFRSDDALALVAPFPPPDIMFDTTGLTAAEHFAAHGATFLAALAAASARPLNSFQSILDFGVGAGRLARMFKGFQGKYVGVDIDERNLAWLRNSLPYVIPRRSKPREALPCSDAEFDAVISISVFTHMNESDQIYYLDELRRVTRPGACLFLTVHGDRALHLADQTEAIRKLMSVTRSDLAKARATLEQGSGFHFFWQKSHLTSAAYDYGMTFISETYIRKVWGRYFSVVEVRRGALHEFQDIVVLERGN